MPTIIKKKNKKFSSTKSYYNLTYRHQKTVTYLKNLIFMRFEGMEF